MNIMTGSSTYCRENLHGITIAYAEDEKLPPYLTMINVVLSRIRDKRFMHRDIT